MILKLIINSNLYVNMNILRWLAEKQKWAIISPIVGVTSLVAVLFLVSFSEPIFWALLLVPLYFLHQTEEFIWPGGYKEYMNQNVYYSEKGIEYLTDKKLFWVNMLLGWIPFIVLGVLSFENIGCGVSLVVLTIMNVCVHVFHAIRQKEYNPGLIVAIIQLLVCIVAGYLISIQLEEYVFVWWSDSIFFVALARLIAYKVF